MRPEGPSRHLRWAPRPPDKDTYRLPAQASGKQDEVTAQKSALQTLGSSPHGEGSATSSAPRTDFHRVRGLAYPASRLLAISGAGRARWGATSRGKPLGHTGPRPRSPALGSALPPQAPGEGPSCFSQLLGPQASWACGCVTPPLPPSPRGLLLCPDLPLVRALAVGLGPALLQCDHILADYICSDPISKGGPDMGRAHPSVASPGAA